jgi:hypothetical protein
MVLAKRFFFRQARRAPIDEINLGFWAVHDISHRPFLPALFASAFVP